jgi:hypothetical protein
VTGVTTHTWGVDLSTDPRGTAAVRIEWSDGRADVVRVVSPITAPELAELIAGHRDDTWGIDVPFGWPQQFETFLGAHRTTPTAVDYVEGSWASPLRLRRTDRSLTAGDPARRVHPLSVAHDRLGSVAVLWASVEHALAHAEPPVVIDRSGMTGVVFETYPSGIRVAWGLPKRGAEGERDAVIGAVAAAGIDVMLLASRGDDATEHEWDALLCALAARAHQLGDRPRDLTQDDVEVGATEGWIHLPTRSLGSLVGNR